MTINSFGDLARCWKDEPLQHEAVLIEFDRIVREVPRLNSHRDWVEVNEWGFGHRAFHGVWLQLAKELPDGFSFLEIGVHRGQSLSAIDLAAQIVGKSCSVVGLSPLNGACPSYYTQKDYTDDVEQIFKLWNRDHRPLMIKGYSTDEAAKEAAYAIAPFDVIYLDGDHDDPVASQDVSYYPSLVKVGGYFISDDSTVGFNVLPWFFQGFEGSTKACNRYFDGNPKWQELGNVMHMRIFKRLYL